MPFPHLQKICLRQDQTRESGHFLSADGPIPVTRDILPPVLEERRRLNAPVKSIDIKQCHVSEEWVDELKGNVPTVTWDGKTTPDGYDDDEIFDRQGSIAAEMNYANTVYLEGVGFFQPLQGLLKLCIVLPSFLSLARQQQQLGNRVRQRRMVQQDNLAGFPF